MRSLAGFAMRGPSQAALVAAGTAVLSLLLPLVAVVVDILFRGPHSDPPCTLSDFATVLAPDELISLLRRPRRDDDVVLLVNDRIALLTGPLRSLHPDDYAEFWRHFMSSHPDSSNPDD